MALPGDTVYITNVQPQVITDVAGCLVKFLIDTGATFSVLTQRIGNLHNHKKYVMGFSGKKQGHNFLEPVLCSPNGQLFLHSFLVLPDCPIPLMRRDLLRKLGAILFLEGQRNHPHCQMILTENRKGQVESEVEVEDLLDPGMWNSEVPGLAKDIQLMVTIQDSQEIAVVYCRGHQSQILRSEIGKENHQVDQEANKAAYIPTDKTQAVLKVLGFDRRNATTLLYEGKKLH